MNAFETLQRIRARGVKANSCGLDDRTVQRFLTHDQQLSEAIEAAALRLTALEAHESFEGVDEAQLAKELQASVLNFYPVHGVSPYIPLGAQGPWVVTLSGAVIYDTGGYGMLGLGHNPKHIVAVMSAPHIMANVMTPSFYHREMVSRLKKAIGLSRHACPFDQFVFMNSGSEAMAVAYRLADAHAKSMTDPGAKYSGKRIMSISLGGSFHGRTAGPARVSGSSRKYYQAALASFRELDNLRMVAPNDVEALEQAFAWARQESVYIQAVFMEPVMGEGNPGMAITREFYDAARRLCTENDSFLIIDSIQAALRAQGVLSIIDYPGFEDAEAPDMESYSKALNAGQYPLSVLALRDVAAQCYRPGIYGNTMTTNPRALAIGCAVLDSVNDTLRENIRSAGREFVARLESLKARKDGKITAVQGTGLLVSAALREDIPVVGVDASEERLRKRGINVIHGGTNSLRFTPHFGITSDEIGLICEMVDTVLADYD